MSKEEMAKYLSDTYGYDFMGELLEAGMNEGFTLQEVFDGIRYLLGDRFGNNEHFTVEQIAVMIGKTTQETEKLIKEVKQKAKVRFL